MQRKAAEERVGLPPGLAVATPGGWLVLRHLVPGARIWTASGALRLMALEPGQGGQRMLLPAGALGNRRALWLPPEARVLIDCDSAEAICGERLVLLPVAAAEGWRGVRRVRVPAPLLLPVLERAAVIHAGPGLMLACPGQGDDWQAFDALSQASAQQMLACEMAEELGAALRLR